jgi:adenine deaminase
MPKGPSEKESATLIEVALGRVPADMVITHARVLNVYTGEWLKDCAVSIKGRFIVHVGAEALEAIGENTQEIDAKGQVLVPGFIDGHTHLTWLVSMPAFLPYAIVGGTTTVITETMETFPVGGLAGLSDILDSFGGQPIKALALAPAGIATSPAAHGIDMADLDELLARSDVVGLGESYWQSVLQTPEVMLPIIEACKKTGKSIEGHTAGASGKKLMAYVACGVGSCHEPILPEEVLERLRLGIYVMIREGNVRRDLENTIAVKDAGVDLRRLILVTDGVSPQGLVKNGYLEKVLQKAIDLGYDPVQAIRMVTLNVAEHFKLDHLIGGIAPGRCADLVILPDEKTIRAKYVISNGVVVAKDGQVLVAPRRHDFPPQTRQTVRLDHPLKADDFKIAAPSSGTKATCRVIEMVTDLVTTERHIELPLENGCINLLSGKGLNKVAAVERSQGDGQTFVGLIKDFGLQKGAVACSAAWDTADIIVVGADNGDMALAVNRVKDLNGGIVVCVGGEVLAEVALPILGVISDQPMESLAAGLDSVNATLLDLGVTFPDALLSLVTLTASAIPYLRICEKGLVNLKDGKPKPLIVG